jgi:hypothetical protein
MSRTQGRIRHVTEAASLRIEAGMGRPSPELRSRLTFGRSPVRESRTPGSVRGDRGDPAPYRDCNSWSQDETRSVSRKAYLPGQKGASAIPLNTWNFLPVIGGTIFGHSAKLPMKQ